MRQQLPLCLIAALLAAGCPSEADDDDSVANDDDTVANDDDTVANDDDSSGDDDDSAEGPVGQVTAIWWSEDALFDWPDLSLHAVFSDDAGLLAAEDAVGRLSLSGVDVFAPDAYWDLPPVGSRVPFHPDDHFVDLDTVSTLDAGPWVAAGEHLAAGHLDLEFEDSGVHIYEQSQKLGADAALLQDPGADLDVSWAGGDDIAEAASAGTLHLPTPPSLTSVDPSFPIPLRAGADLDLAWLAADADSTVVVSAFGEVGGTVEHLADSAGSTSFTWEELAALGAEPFFGVARLRSDDVDTPDGTVALRGVARQFLYGERVGPWSLDVPVWPAGTTRDVQLAWWDGTLTGSATLDAGDDVSFGTASVADTLGHRLDVSVTVDAAAETGPRDITVTDASGFVATEAAWIVGELPAEGACADAVDEGDPGDGAYFGSDDGLVDSPFDTSECATTPDGRDQAIPISLQAGERLRARLLHGGFRGSLYLVGGCDDSAPAFPCVTAATEAPEVELEYVALDDEDLLLIVDSASGAAASAKDYVVDIRRDGPFPFVFDLTYFGDGSHADVPVWSTAGDWTQGDLSFDLGDGVTLDAVDVIGGSGDYAEIDLTVAPGATVGPRTVSITTTALGTVAVPDAIDIGSFVYTTSCAQAANAGPGVYQGSTSFAAWGETSGETCLSSTQGSEALIRVDLGPGETLSALVTANGWDAAIYIVESCDPTAFAVTCADNALAGDTEYLEWAGSAAGGPVWLVIDGVSPSDEGEFDLILEVIP